ncbi:MAG TPA: ABC transporter permease subunit [Candidatus Ventrimonas merdavium]|nr:ABC transporter permease subunit [Candidatus Ventrimonas merdavium]
MRTKKGIGRKKTYLAALLPFLVLVCMFELLPVAITILRSFLKEGGGFQITLENYVNIFAKPLYRSAITNSLIVSIVSSVIGLLVAFLAGKAAYEKGGKTKRIFMSILNMVSNFSGVPLAFSFIILFGNAGVVTILGQTLGIQALADFPLYTIWGLLLTYIYFQIPLSTLLMIPAFESIRKEWKEAVAIMGGTNRTFWMKVGIPVLGPSILGTFSTLFANAIAAYATAYALLMNNFSILPIRIAEQFKGDIVQRPEFGSALSVILMLLMVLSIAITQNLTKKTGGVKR